MLRNVVFDLGNVLLSFKPLEYLRSWVRDEQEVQQLYQAVFCSGQWPQLDRGTVTPAAAAASMAAQHPLVADGIRYCMDHWHETLVPIEGTVEILAEVNRRGYQTLILSNFHRDAYEYVRNRYAFFQNFAGGVISYQEHFLKPELEIYQCLVSRYGIDPKETVFIDDMAENVEAAERLGFRTVLFRNEVDLRQILTAWDVLASG